MLLVGIGQRGVGAAFFVKDICMTQDVNFYDKPLSDEEFVEIGELLALMPEPYESMEPDRMDGFLTSIALLPEPVAPS